MYREPGGTLDLRGVLATGRAQFGPGRYETLLHLGEQDGHPMLTITSPWAADAVDHTAPSAAYLRMLVTGLREAHGWSSHRAAHYLATRPGCAGSWTAAEIVALDGARPGPAG